MSLRKPIWIVVALLIFSLNVSCEKDPTGGEYNLNSDILSIISATQLSTIISLGMPVFEGSDPPDIQGIFYESPHTLKASNHIGDSITYVYNPWKFQLSNQDFETKSISLDFKSGKSIGYGLTSFLSGSGNNFTLFAKVLADKNGYKSEYIRIISGTITEEGIDGCHIAFFMVDDYGDPADQYIAEGECRVLYDSDGLAERQEEF